MDSVSFDQFKSKPNESEKKQRYLSLKLVLILFLLFIFVSSDVFIFNILGRSPSFANRDGTLSSTGIVAQGVALVLLFIIGDYLVSNQFL
jgi:hypothetical protein